MNNRKENSNAANKLTLVLFVIYMIVLLWILIFKLGVHFSYMESRRVNLIPFGRSAHSTINLSEIILNVIIFVPLGLYAGILFKRWILGKLCLFVFLTSFAIENLQYIFRIGAFDVTDIITNVSGGIIGWVIFKLIEKLFNNSARSHKFINIIAATGTILMISLLLMLKLNLLPVRYQ